MAGYKERVRRDLDGWIAAGLVPASAREGLLSTIPESGRMDAAAALGLLGMALLGAAIVALVAANWNGIPRLVRFGLLLAGFLGAAGGATWATRRERPLTVNGLVTLAALIFAAAVGLTGQIFDIAGEPATALHASGLAAGVLALAAGASGPGIVALVLLGFGDLIGSDQAFGVLLPAAAVGALAAWRWTSAPLSHAVGLSLIAWTAKALSDQDHHSFWMMPLTAAAVFSGLALAARSERLRSGSPVGSIFYGWLAVGAIAFLIWTQFDLWSDGLKVVGRGSWLVASGGVIALGRHDRHAVVTAAGVLALLGAVAATLFDFGLGLGVAAAVFAACAALALAGGWLLRPRATP